MKKCEFSELHGKTLSEIIISENRIEFITKGGNKYAQYHEQDGGESVWLETHDGDISDLIGSEILLADEVTDATYNPKSWIQMTHTFYKLATIKGSCTFIWRGESNGCYSETVDIFEI